MSSKFWGGGSDSSESSSEEDTDSSLSYESSDDDHDNQGPSKYLQDDSSDSSEDEKRILRSVKDKRHAELRAIVDEVYIAIRNIDWILLLSLFEKLNKQAEKAQRAVHARVPRIYFRVLLDIEDELNSSFDDKDARKRMSSSNAKAFMSLRQRVKKHNKMFETELEYARNHPDSSSESDVEKLDHSEAIEGEKLNVSEIKFERSEKDGILILRTEKKDITYEMVEKKLSDLCALRGKKGTDKEEFVDQLTLLSTVAKCAAQETEILINVISAQFDISGSMTSYMPVKVWNLCVQNVLKLLSLLVQNHHILIVDHREPLSRPSPDAITEATLNYWTMACKAMPQFMGHRINWVILFIKLRLIFTNMEMNEQELVPYYVRFHERSLEQEKLERRRQMPFHLHINIETLESMYMISSMIVEATHLIHNSGHSRSFGKPFSRFFDVYERQSFNGPPENIRDTIMCATNFLLTGEWRKAAKLVSNMSLWSSLGSEGESIRGKLVERMKEVSLEVYLVQYASEYTAVDLSTLKEMFDLSASALKSISCRMISLEEITGAFDGRTNSVTVGDHVDKSPLQFAATRFAEKVAILLDSNDRALNYQLGAIGMPYQVEEDIGYRTRRGSSDDSGLGWKKSHFRAGKTAAYSESLDRKGHRRNEVGNLKGKMNRKDDAGIRGKVERLETFSLDRMVALGTL
ncbi:unnamed protein product [Bathycoccus prasinos]